MAGQIPGGDDRVGRQPVDLGVVEQQEEGADPADAVAGVGAVKPGAGDAVGLQAASRSAARARSPASGPNWIDFVGQAWAHAGSSPPFSRS